MITLVGIIILEVIMIILVEIMIIQVVIMIIQVKKGNIQSLRMIILVKKEIFRVCF